MEKFILELIKENNRVIIPNFGAFIISKENGLSILFNNFLSFNDGLLVNYIAEKKGIDTIVATDQVFEYVDKLKKQLDETGEYGIIGLGQFKKDDSGILRFMQDENFMKVIGDEIIEKEAENKNKAEELSEPEDKEELLDLDKAEDISNVSDEDKKEPTKFVLNTEEEDDQMLTLEEETKPVAEEKKEEEKFESPVAPPVVEKKEEPKRIIIPQEPIKKIVTPTANKYANKAREEKKKKDIITFVVIACLALLVVVVYFVFFNKPKKVVEVKKPMVIQVEEPKSEPVDTMPKFEEVEVKRMPVPDEPVLKKKDIHIIVGGFKEESNAINMVDKLQKKGFAKSMIIPKGNMFLVSIDSDPSYRKMEARQQEILEKEMLESWMYTVK